MRNGPVERRGWMGLGVAAVIALLGPGRGAGAASAPPTKDLPGAPGLSASDIARLKFGTPGLIKDKNAVIYGTQAGYDLVMEARKYDPNYAPESQRDRDKAAELYAMAIEAQPGAKSNATLANRIAQMYAFNADPARGLMPNREEAARWWNRCVELTDETQMLWAQAQMGLGNMSRILEMKAERLELPPWIDWADPMAGGAEEKRARMLKDFAEIQAKARQLLAEREARAATDLARVEAMRNRNPGVPPTTPAAEAAAPEPEEEAPPHAAESAPATAPLAVAEGNPEGTYREAVLIGAAAVAAALGGLGVVLSRRRRA